MKVGIITITNGANFGNRLQNYATQEVLSKLGFEVETINNITGQRIEKKNPLKNILEKAILQVYHNIPITNIKRFNFLLRMEKFKEFTNKNISKSKYTISKDNVPKGIEDYYDFFVCGSDQIWNPDFSFNSEIDFLTFAKEGQRISYAASFGVNEIPTDRIEEYRSWINGLDYISVREYVGAAIVKKLTGREALVSIDPTLLLTKEEWLKIARKPKVNVDEKYILVYFLGNKNDEVTNKINQIASENNLKVYDLLDICEKGLFSADPSEFIYLINNAELMCTDSFHGVVFSLIMKIPFIVFERRDDNKSMNSRLDTLLSLFDMGHRIDSKVQSNYLNVDFSNVDKIIEQEKKKSIDYLNNAFSLNELILVGN